MTNPSKDLLTTTEGVDEGSAASTVEDRSSGASPAAGGAVGAAPETDEAPVDVQTDDSREQPAPGQQLEAGEG